MKLFFVRHGQSEANILNEFSNRGFKHPLTQKGVEQSERLASEMRGIAFKKVFSSPVLRAIQTTVILTGRLGIPSFEVNEALREHDVGTLEGKADEESWKLFFEMQETWESQENRDRRYHGGESYNETIGRFTRFIRDVVELDAEADDNLLFIGHGGLYIAAIPALVDNLKYSFTRKNLIDNTEMILVEGRNAVFKCLQWGKMSITTETQVRKFIHTEDEASRGP